MPAERPGSDHEADAKRDEIVSLLGELPVKRRIKDFFFPKNWQRQKAEQQRLVELYKQDTHEPSELVFELVRNWGKYETALRKSLQEIKQMEPEMGTEVSTTFEVEVAGRQFRTSIKKIKSPGGLEHINLETMMLDPNTFPESEIKENVGSLIHLGKGTLESGEILKREIVCLVSDDLIRIKSLILSRQEISALYPDAKGLATLIMRLSHRINNILIDEIGQGKPRSTIMAEITDASGTGWSGKRAEELGYTYTPHERKQRGREPVEPDKIWEYSYT